MIEDLQTLLCGIGAIVTFIVAIYLVERAERARKRRLMDAEMRRRRMPEVKTGHPDCEESFSEQERRTR